MLNAVDGIGPCVIVIETVCGRVFGGFANEGFICGPSYTGDMTCFLFEDRTRLAIHTATGFNQNFAYLNHSQQTLPNGLVCFASFHALITLEASSLTRYVHKKAI